MNFLSKFAKKIANWYRGEYVPITSNSDDKIVIISGGYYVQSTFAKMLGVIGRFIAVEWKWLLGTAVALLAIYANYALKH